MILNLVYPKEFVYLQRKLGINDREGDLKSPLFILFFKVYEAGK